MKQDYIAVADKSRIYPPGVAANGDGFDVCFISEAESCGLLLFKKGSRQPVARIPFPHEGRMGNVHFMTVKGVWNTPLRRMERRQQIRLDGSLQAADAGAIKNGEQAGSIQYFRKKVRILTGKMTVFRLFLLRTASFTRSIPEVLQSMLLLV